MVNSTLLRGCLTLSNGYTPGICLSSILGLQPSKTRSFPIKTRVSCAPCTYIMMYLIVHIMVGLTSCWTSILQLTVIKTQDASWEGEKDGAMCKSFQFLGGFYCMEWDSGEISLALSSVFAITMSFRWNPEPNPFWDFYRGNSQTSIEITLGA